MTWSSASLQLLQASTQYCRVWLPHLGQRLSAKREHENAEDHFAIAVREHSDTRADEDVDNRPIVGHLLQEVGLISQLSPRCTTYLGIV